MAETSSAPVLGASRSVYYSLTDEVPGLTEEEKNKLEDVMKKALEFEAEEANKMRQPLEGQLYKYTNVMKGWQPRWLVVTPDTGMLEYYMLDERRKSKPRGALCLMNAIVSPSEEDNQSFSVSAFSGEVYKLKASDAKERQIWVDKIRTVIERHSSTTPNVIDQQADSQSSFAFCSSPNISDRMQPQIDANIKKSKLSSSPEKTAETSTDSIAAIKSSVYKAIECQKNLAKSIEDLPFSGPYIRCSDNKLLLIKAISQATVQSLEQCYLILKRNKQREALKSSSPLLESSVESLDKLKGSTVRKDKRVENVKNV